ncbi:hypothetical protein ART_1984 [Arthrobacter sp. PAMC 25486]|nr:hypothetical protein ART_1984 [Arthrobacter sp. PAMC 25486]
MAMLMGAALQGEARWDGDVLYVETALENDGDNLGAITACGIAQKMLDDTTLATATVVFEFGNGTVKFTDIKDKIDAARGS